MPGLPRGNLVAGAAPRRKRLRQARARVMAAAQEWLVQVKREHGEEKHAERVAVAYVCLALIFTPRKFKRFAFSDAYLLGEKELTTCDLS